MFAMLRHVVFISEMFPSVNEIPVLLTFVNNRVRNKDEFMVVKPFRITLLVVNNRDYSFNF